MSHLSDTGSGLPDQDKPSLCELQLLLGASFLQRAGVDALAQEEDETRWRSRREVPDRLKQLRNGHASGCLVREGSMLCDKGIEKCKPRGSSEHPPETALPCGILQSRVTLATPSSTGMKRGIVPRRRFQRGTFVKRHGNWIGMWRVDVMGRTESLNASNEAKRSWGCLNEQPEPLFSPYWILSTHQMELHIQFQRTQKPSRASSPNGETK